MTPIHLYCMPGMAASPKIFEYLKLPKNFQIHLLSWIPPLKDEPIGKYAKRMSTRIIFENPILRWYLTKESIVFVFTIICKHKQYKIYRHFFMHQLMD